MGYSRAGFEVVGVDIAPQPNYPFTFVEDDALSFPAELNHSGWPRYDAIHASPPCQGYVGWQNISAARGGENDWPRLIEPVRELLEATGLPWVPCSVGPLHALTRATRLASTASWTAGVCSPARTARSSAIRRRCDKRLRRWGCSRTAASG